MKDLKSLQSEYGLIKMHQDGCFCHSMDKKGYKILCKNFFANDVNKKLALALADETIITSLESEKNFLQWLNMEWYD